MSAAEDPDDVDVWVGERIRHFRHHAGLSQSTLARALGLTFQQVQKYEKGMNRVSASKIYKIAQALGQSIEAFFPPLTQFPLPAPVTPT